MYIPQDNVIPVIYQRMNYFNKIYYDFNDLNTPFREKKFCLFTSRNLLNNNKRNIIRALQQLGQVDTLDRYNNKIKINETF